MQKYFKTDEKSSKVSLSIKGIFHFKVFTHLFFVFSIPEWSFNPVVLTGMYSSRDENYSRRKRVNVRDISQYRQG